MLSHLYKMALDVVKCDQMQIIKKGITVIVIPFHEIIYMLIDTNDLLI